MTLFCKICFADSVTQIFCQLIFIEVIIYIIVVQIIIKIIVICLVCKEFVDKESDAAESNYNSCADTDNLPDFAALFFLFVFHGLWVISFKVSQAADRAA